MKRFGIVALIAAACVGGIAGSLMIEILKPSPVAAEEFPRAEAGIRIAIVNLELVARRSKEFHERKQGWQRANEDFKAHNNRMRREYEALTLELNHARQAGEPEHEVLYLRIELQSLEEAMKAAEREQREYLTVLREQYQAEVIQAAMVKIMQYAEVEGIDLVLQDHSESFNETDFLRHVSFNEAMMSKGVLGAPGMTGNRNKYIRDITNEVK